MSVSDLSKAAEDAILATANTYGATLDDKSFETLVRWLESSDAYKSPMVGYTKPRFPTMPVDLLLLHEGERGEITLTLILSRTPDSSAHVEAVLYGKYELAFPTPAVVEEALLDWATYDAEEVLTRYASEPLETLH